MEDVPIENSADWLGFFDEHGQQMWLNLKLNKSHRDFLLFAYTAFPMVVVKIYISRHFSNLIPTKGFGNTGAFAGESKERFIYVRN
jgi:hypothetical protein